MHNKKGLALRAEQRRQLAEARLQMLKNQIEPHFIFNTLAHLQALIKSEPDVAERVANELSDFLRASLASLRQDEFRHVHCSPAIRVSAIERVRRDDMGRLHLV